MKKFLRYLLIIVGIIIVIIGGLAAFVAIRGIPEFKPQAFNFKVTATPERLETGRKLITMLCADCHMNPNTGRLTGRKMDEVPQFGEIYSKNITQHPEFGIGKWTDGEIAYLLKTGITPKGKFLPVMAKLHKRSDEDMQ
jgi:hypothetical protein